MNGNCQTCDVEKDCDYEYKPCDCCNYRKFKPKVLTKNRDYNRSKNYEPNQ